MLSTDAILSRRRCHARVDGAGQASRDVPAVQRTSASRRNRRKRCLGVWIDDRGVRFFCIHCGWRKARFFDEGERHGHDNGTFRGARDAGWKSAASRASWRPRSGCTARAAIWHSHTMQPDGTWASRNGADRTKRFRIEPCGRKLTLWLLRSLARRVVRDADDDRGRDRRVVVPGGGRAVRRVGAERRGGRPGEGDIVPADDTGFTYLWDGDAAAARAGAVQALRARRRRGRARRGAARRTRRPARPRSAAGS